MDLSKEGYHRKMIKNNQKSASSENNVNKQSVVLRSF
jgi:hypothetical protein